MSIDPTTIIAASGISPGHKIAVDSQKNVRKLFEYILDDTVNSLKSNEVSQKETIAWMRLAQLQMLQGIFTVNDEKDSHDVFTGVLNGDGLSQLRGQQSQIIDKYYATQSISVSKPVSQEPNPIGEMINQVAAKVCLAPELIHSIVATESAYNPVAVSHAGAQGLMQLMPETAQELGVEDSFDPLQNLLGGS